MFPIKKPFVFLINELLESFDDIARPALSLALSFFVLRCPTHIHTYKDEHTHYSVVSENFLERQFSYTKEELEGFIPLRKEGGRVHDAL